MKASYCVIAILLVFASTNVQQTQAAQFIPLIDTVQKWWAMSVFQL